MGTNKPRQNRLIHEKSPYLLQHAANPVDWYAWGNEAFAKAAEENKLILLSIGYSSCHWCHVMAHESFESEEIARMMNACFVCVKVDREERPDIDHIYMTAVTAMTGQGGWPLTVFLTPDRKPFFGGTYFPPHAKWGMPGLADIIGSIHSAWENNPEQLLQSGANLASMLRTHSLKLHPGRAFEKDILAKAFQQFATLYDSQYAGFGTAPKFPSSHNLSFLLRYWKRTKESKALSMVEETLTRMAEGGIYDHLGGGFHRYATDQKWQIPHFEKMLYDQAITLKTYLEAYQINKKELYARIARETCDYVLNDMQYREGGFYSAQDADSFDPQDYEKNPSGLHDGDKKEGAYYLWRYEEVEKILEKDEAAIFNYYYGVNPDGNAESDPHGEFTGKNILHVARSLQETAAQFNKSEAEIKTVLERARKKLLEYRRKRPASFLDDKILTDWNGLMISSLAIGARVLTEPRYSTAAQKAADFILKKLHKNGELLHRYRDGEAAMPGTLSDYAFFIQGLLDLYEATFEPAYLKTAKDLTERMINLFWDPDGGFYFTAENAEGLLFRPKEIYDGAIPSGNSVAALDLIRLYHILLDETLREKYEKLFEMFSTEVTQNPAAYGQMLMAVDFAWGASQIVLAGKKEDHLLQTMTQRIYECFIPNKVVVHNPDNSTMVMNDLSPFAAKQTAINGNPTAYICLNHTCQQPVYELEKLDTQLKQL